MNPLPHTLSSKPEPVSLWLGGSAWRSGLAWLFALVFGGVVLGVVSSVSAQVLDESWTLTVAGQSVKANPNGTVRIRNISAPDLFGIDGPGTAPDFVSDNFVRLTGVQTKDGVSHYVFSEPFLFRARETFVISNLTFTDFPPLLPASIRVRPDQPTLTAIDQVTQARVTATLQNGSTVDVSPRTRWTSYRTSNPGIATVDRDGFVTAHSKGMVFITAINEGATSVAQVDVSPGDPLTTVIGIVQKPDGQPLPDATVRLAGGAALAITDAGGHFIIRDVATQLGLSGLVAYKLGDGLVFGAKGGLILVPGGVTDAGFIIADGNCSICPDQDGDGLPDDLELALRTNSTRKDTDGDGLNDYFELIYANTDPLVRDSNANGISDDREDADGDGLTTRQEQQYGTHPLLYDSDGDLWDDAAEVNAGSNPVEVESTPQLFFSAAPPLGMLVTGPSQFQAATLGTVVAAPPTTVLVPGLGEIGQITLGMVVAQPPTTVLVPGIGPLEAVSLGTVVAQPPVTLLVPGLASFEAVTLGVVIAQPPLSVLVPGQGPLDSFSLGTVAANPPVALLVPGLSVLDSVSLGIVIAQPPLNLLVPGTGQTEAVTPGTMLARPPVSIQIAPQ